MSLFARFCQAFSRGSDFVQPTPYRSGVENTEGILRDAEACIAALRLQVRVQRAQLEARGEVPLPTLDGDGFILLADLLYHLSRNELPPLNTVKLAELAALIRGFARYV